MSEKENVLISMCSLGVPCQYHGAKSFCREKFVAQLKDKYNLIPVCPEQLGGLSTPRSACRVVHNKVLGRDGKDYTDAYEKGARFVLHVAKKLGATKAYLKKGSPSCGKNGVCRKLLEKEGFNVCQI